MKLKKTFLHNYHLTKLNVSIMGPFAGYDMPIEYKNLGISIEALNCRQNASVFDVSHMGQVKVFGQDRTQFMEKFVVGDSVNLNEGKCSLSLVLNEKGGIMDDVIFSKHPDHL
jgi:aminomethyltransferase